MLLCFYLQTIAELLKTHCESKEQPTGGKTVELGQSTVRTDEPIDIADHGGFYFTLK